jgi:FdhD protein
MEPIRETTIVKVKGEEGRPLPDELVRETQAVIYLNRRKVLDVTCSPGALRELSYGYLLSEGWIRSVEDLESISIDEDHRSASVSLRRARKRRASAAPVASPFASSPSEVACALEEAQSRGELFRRTGAAHLAAVLSADGSCALAEDVSRSCALEKAFGRALVSGFDAGRSLLLLTSRVPQRFIEKAARVGIPIVAAVSAPTYEAVQAAERLGICLCGFVRKDRMNVYSRAWRVGL